MADLAQQVRTFLEAEGYAVSPRRELLVGSRRTLAEETDYTYVWVPAKYDPATFASREAGFLSFFQEVARSNPTASRFMIVPTLEGLSRNFREGVLKWYRVNIRTPVQFFDTDFKWEVSREAPSAARELREKGLEEKGKRVAQPYTREDSQESGEDLLQVLSSALTRSAGQGKAVHIVAGPAGIGKSYLFDVLFAELHEAFMEYKTKGGPYAPRPLPLLPQYIPLADAHTVRSILSAYLQTDFVRPLRRETFEWLLVNELALWMLDGLDEVISRDVSFFDYILHLLTLPEAPARPKILICVRDALLSTNEALREFMEEYPDQVAIYRLAKWKTPSKRKFAEMVLCGSAPEFLGILRDRPSLNELAATPYYCDLLCHQFAAGRLREEYSETSLLEHALLSFIERDYEKGFVDKAWVTPNDVVAFLEAAAMEDFECGFQGVSVRDAQEWVRILLPSELDENEQARLGSQMVSLGLFARGSPGYIRFAQEILEHYLLGRRLVSLFENQPMGDTFVRSLAHREIPCDWVTVRLLAEHVKRTNQFGRLRNLIFEAAAYPVAFKNVLKIALLCADSPTAMRDIPYERHDLSGLEFEGLDLHTVSFRGCNLTDTEFRNCNLRGAVFVDAIIKNTGFLSLPPDGLRGAEIGDLTTFFSMRLDRARVVEDHGEAHRWFQQRTQERAPMVEPCASALQLRYLFNKLVYPNGTVRRSWLTRRAVLSGKRFHSSPEDVLEAAIRHGYLHEEERYRDRIHRPEGRQYSELVEYAASLRLTAGIKALLDDVCYREGCPHVPVVR
jgi:hypothetical protein